MVERVKLLKDTLDDDLPLSDVVPKRKTIPPQLEPSIRNPDGRRKRSKPNAKEIAKNVRKLGYGNKGYLPHEILLRIAQGRKLWHGRDEDGNKIWIQPTLDDRIRCAIAAAPYYAPKLSTVEIIQGTTDDELDEIIKTSAAAAGLSISLTGEGEEAEFTVDEPGGEHDARFAESKEVDS